MEPPGPPDHPSTRFQPSPKAGGRRVLVVYATPDWPAAALVARPLVEAGFEVYAYGPADHLIALSPYLAGWAGYTAPIDAARFGEGLGTLASQWDPELVLAGDDPALWLLVRLRLGHLPVAVPPVLATLLERSLGRSDRLLDLERKSSLPEVSKATGVPIAATLIAPDPAAARAFGDEHGWPVVVKLDYTWGGMGVRFAETPAALQSALNWRPDLASFAPRTVSLSAYLAGPSYGVPYTAWQGRLTGCLPVVKVSTTQGGGSAVVEPVGDPALATLLTDYARRIVGYFGLSGCGDLDLRGDLETGLPCLLEVNPRVVPALRAGSYLGVRPWVGLYQAMENEGFEFEPGQETPEAAFGAGVYGVKRRVALFPAEWLANPKSPHLIDACHDVPWDEPLLLAEMLRRLAPGVGRGARP